MEESGQLEIPHREGRPHQSLQMKLLHASSVLACYVGVAGLCFGHCYRELSSRSLACGRAAWSAADPTAHAALSDRKREVRARLSWTSTGQQQAHFLGRSA